jgi:hypothetical protein
MQRWYANSVVEEETNERNTGDVCDALASQGDRKLISRRPSIRRSPS